VKLNLGCGENKKDGFINVDKFGNPDVKHDLEVFPWPWDDDSVDEILMNHILEHLGETTEVFLGIMKEMYRICKAGAKIMINCPHPRHDDFISDPTHVRPIIPRMFDLFSKKNNELWIKGGFANSPLAIYLDVDFEAEDVKYCLDSPWKEEFADGEISAKQIDAMVRIQNNIIKETKTVLRVVK